MYRQMLLSICVVCLVLRTASTNRDRGMFHLLQEAKERVKHQIECFPPSKYFAGSCYTYMKMAPAPSWERAYNSCSSLPMANDARLLSIESIEEYEFIERELIGLKSGSESVSVYIGLRKVNNTWFWSNHIALKETAAYRFWVDNNRDILAYDCGILWLARNTSVITPAPCVEQALRPYVCKQIIDRCYNNSGGCGKFGTCLNLPATNSHRCQCRFLYTGDRCEKWSSQGLQVIIGVAIVIVAFIASYIINTDRTDDSWSFRLSVFEQYQLCRSHRSARQVSNPELVQTSTPNTKPRWRPPSVRFDDLKRCSLSSLSLPDTGLISSLSSMTFKRLVTLILPLALTILICVLIVHTRHYIKQNVILSTQVFQFCVLYENNYYLNLLTLPIALVIILCLVSNQTRIERARSQANKFSIHLPVPFNPFSKIHRFDTMILSGIISHEILGIIEEIFLKTTTAQIKLLTIHGPLFDLIRQIGLVSIVGLRFYPVYAVMDMSHRNILYYALCALYMWLDLALRIFEQIFCVNNSSFVRTWQKFQLLKDETNSIIATSTMAALEDDEFRSGLPRDRMTFRRVRPSTTTMVSSIQSFPIYEKSLPPVHSINVSSVNMTAFLSHNYSQSTFDQFGLDSSLIHALKYIPYYFCLIYICLRLTYLFLISTYRLFFCCDDDTHSTTQPLKHIYQKPTFKPTDLLSIEYYYVRQLFQSERRTSIDSRSWIESLLHRIYRPHRYFQYSKQILNMYMIAFIFIYYLTFNVLQTGVHLIEKVYSFFLMPLVLLYDGLDLLDAKPLKLKYEIVCACALTAIIYWIQLFAGLKNYRRHMLQAYRGSGVDIPPKSAFRTARLMAKHIHYPGYCIAYLAFGYVMMGNVLFLLIAAVRILCKHLFLVEDMAKISIPILVIYLSNFIIHWFLSQTFFLQKAGKTMVLRNLRIYFVFTYFNFFFDCCLGMVSCAFRVVKAFAVTVLFMPRLDYCIFGRALERADAGFIAYASFIHMECLHTHPVLVYFCSVVNEQIDQRAQQLRSSKRDVYLYAHRQRVVFRWWLAITLSRNQQLRRARKHRFIHSQFSSLGSCHQPCGRKRFIHFQTPDSIENDMEEFIDSTTVLRNHTTTCTTLLLDMDEQDDRKPSF